MNQDHHESTAEDGGRKFMSDLESMIQTGRAEVEPIYYTPWMSASTAGPSGASGHSSNGSSNGHNSNGGGSSNGNQKSKLKRGKVYRYKENNDFICFVAHDNVAYRPGDCVYIDSQRIDQPHFVAGIQNFKLTKRDQLNVLIKWYYRPCEIPETVYRTLVQDRHTDNNSTGVGCSSICLKDPIVQSRELFISDAVDTYPVSALRGKCVVYHLRDICTTAKDTKKLTRDDSFFYVLGYNPENNRLASITGEIRIGSNHQARLPALKERQDDEQGRKTKISPDDDQVRESLCWMPESLVDNDILMYLRAARSMAIFAGMQNEGSVENGCSIVARDQTTQNAYNSLHKSNYETGQALDDLLKNPAPVSPERKFTDDEIKKFIRGLKLYGKNFFKIRQELLSHKTTSQLIEFYYLWKKTSAAGNQRPRPRQRKPQTTILRRVKTNPGNCKPARPASNEYMDLSSASENESDSDTSDMKDLSAYVCRHCYTTTSKNWHHAGKDKTLLCADCRLYFKKYGELRPVDRSRTPPPSLFTPVKESSSSNSSWPHETANSSRKNSPAGSFGGVKTRRSGKAAAVTAAATTRRKPLTPTADMEKACKTPPLPPTTVEKKSPKSTGKGHKRKSSSNSGSETAASTAPCSSELLSSSSSSTLDDSNHNNDSNPATETWDAAASAAVTHPSTAAAADDDSCLSSPRKLVIAEFASPDASPVVPVVAAPVSRPPSPVPAPPDAKRRKTVNNNTEKVALENESQSNEKKEAPAVSADIVNDVAISLGENPGVNVPTAIAKPVDEIAPSPNLVVSPQVPTQAHSTVIKNYRPPVTTPIIQNMPLKHRIKEEHRSSPTTAFGPSPSNHHFCPIRPPTDVPPAPTTPVLRPSVTYANKNYANSLSNRSTPTTAPPPIDCRQNNEDDGPFVPPGMDGRCLAPGMKEPEPKVDDTECHRSKNAIFRRHWYRGEQSSCARTDLVFSPLPDSKLAKQREEVFRAKAAPSVTIKEEIKEKSPIVNHHHARMPPVVQTLAPPPQPSPYASPISGHASRCSPVEHSPVSTLPPPLFTPSNRSGPTTASTPSSTPKHPSQPSPCSSTNPPLPPNRPPSPTSTPYLNRLSLFAKMVSSAGGDASSNKPTAAPPPNEPRFDHHRDHESAAAASAAAARDQQKRRQHQEMLMQRDFDLASQGLKPAAAPPPLFSPAPQTPVVAAAPGGPPGSSTNAAPPFLQAAPFPGATPTGFMFGMNPTMPPLTDPIAMDRYVAGISAYQLHLERMFSANPSQQLRLEMDRVGACLAALSAAGVMTQHHTHSHTHSHTHLHIHPSTTTAAQSSSSSCSTSNCSSVLAPSNCLPSATTSSALPSAIMTSSTAASSSVEPAPPTPGAPEPTPARLNPFSNHATTPLQPPPGLVAPSTVQHSFGPPPLSAPTNADQFLFQQYAAALSRDPYALAAAAAAAAASQTAPPPGHHLPMPPFSPYHPAAHNPLGAYNPAAAAAAFGAAAGAFFMPQHAPPVGLEALAAERLQQLQAQEFQRRMMLDRDLALGQQHQNVALMQQNEMMRRHFFRRLQQEGNVGGLMNMFNLANQGLLRPGASPFDKRL